MPELTKVQTGFLQNQGPFKLDAGTAAAPGVQFGNDTSTGFYRSAENEIALSVSGTQRLKFTSTGLTFNGTSLDGTPFVGRIDKTISDNATDIFVYDTSKDSDGGAWRKRTTHTSWYNETLNTTIRGSRRQFPAVAVLVLTSDTLTIYDGDDPSLPMWMVFPPEGYLTWASNNPSALSCVHMLNAMLVVGASDGRGGTISCFLKDDTRYFYDTAYYNPIDRTIRGRGVAVSGTSAYTAGGDGYVTLNSGVNDVAMTVLPNAPIDPSTGLPIPTIAVATASGTSVITDTQQVFDITGFAPSSRIGFTKNKLFFTTSVSNTSYMTIGPNLLTADIALTTWEDGGVQFDSSTNSPNQRKLVHELGLRATITENNEVNMAGTAGLYKIQTNPLNVDLNLKCRITNTYNTGWMPGDIRGALLSDTSTTAITGTELITNGDGSSTTGWTAGGGNTLVVDSGRLKCTTNITDGAFFGQGISVVSGKSYAIQATIVSDGTSRSTRMYLGPSIGSAGYAINQEGNVLGGIVTIFWTATFTGTAYLWFYGSVASAGTYILVDNISARVAEEDRSVSNCGLGIYGTILKSAVNTGCDLVAYNGFSSSNYMLQPYNNTNLDFGTGDFTICFWMKTSRTSASGYGDIVSWGNLGVQTYANATKYLLFQITGNPARLLMYYNASGATSFGIKTLNVNTWQFICVTRSGNNMNLYIDGRLSETRSETGTFTPPSNNFDYTLKVGYSGPNYVYPANEESIALLRISKSLTTTDQVRKMFEDEKEFFLENSKTTLYGSSNTVTALTYDDTTRLIHAGTSSGRSDFQGLRRINNTTTAVTTAISASDGFILEQ